jgi:hypothetical protein
MNQSETEGKEKYPGIDLAYKFAVESYEWAAKRYDSMDSRIQSLLGFGMTLTLAVPVAFSALRLNINGWWFIGAACLFIIALCVGIYARLTGELTIITPQMLYEKWLHLPEWEFKKNLIFFSGQHMNKNRDTLKRRHCLAVVATFIYFLELLCLVASVAYRPR